MSKNIETEFKTIRELIVFVLEKYPETRNNDTYLYLECCKYLGAKNLEDIKRLDLSIISVHKIRQVIQNKEGMFQPIEETKKARQRRKLSIKEYMSKLVW